MIDKFTKNTSHPPNVDFGIVPDITGWVFFFGEDNFGCSIPLSPLKNPRIEYKLVLELWCQ